jgi:hypothetical protein
LPTTVKPIFPGQPGLPTRAPIIAVTIPENFNTPPPAPRQLTTTSPIYTEAPIEPICDDPLGVENSKLSPNQVKFSSIKDSGSVKTKIRKNPLETIKLSSQRGWMPLADNTNEFVMVSWV